MKKNLFIILIIAIMAGLGTNCSHEANRNDSNEEMSRPDNRPRDGRGGGQSLPHLGHGRRHSSNRPWNESAVVNLSRKEAEAVGIQTAEVVRQPIQEYLPAMGKVQEHHYRKAIVSYAFSARISARHVRIGDWVKPGDPLITLQSEEVGNAKSEFYKAQADHELAVANYEREKRLYDRGAGAKKDLLSAEAGVKVSRANMNAAEKKLHVLGFTEDQLHAVSGTHQINPVITLYAPIQGKITADNAVLGAMIDQSTEIMTIMDPRLLCIDADIYEKDISNLKDGQEVAVTVPAYPGEVFMGKISYISDILNEETRTITVRTEVANPDGKLKPGMFADIRIFTDKRQDALVIPREAIVDDKDDQIVFREENGNYRPVIIKVGNQQNHHIEILSGLKEGDTIVTEGSFLLKSKLYDEVLKKGHVH